MPVQEKFKAAVAQTSPSFIDRVSINFAISPQRKGVI